MNIIYLLVIWFLGWGIYFYAGKKKLALVYNTEFITAYFLFLAGISFLINRSIFPDYITDNFFFYLAIILLVFIVLNHIYFVIRERFREPLVLILDHPTDKWLLANRQSIFVSLSHILFQQIVITSLILILWNQSGDLWTTAVHFAVIFGLMHVLIALFKGLKFMALYTLPAMAAGMIFTVLLIKLAFAGFVLNYLIHVSFYATITYLFWRKQGKID